MKVNPNPDEDYYDYPDVSDVWKTLPLPESSYHNQPIIVFQMVCFEGYVHMGCGLLIDALSWKTSRKYIKTN
jgi:hypothetical protein